MQYNTIKHLISRQGLGENHRTPVCSLVVGLVKKISFNWFLKVPSVVRVRKCRGREFHVVGAATAKDWSLNCSLVEGTVRSSWEDERSRRLGI